jgi:hypothetical protein
MDRQPNCRGSWRRGTRRHEGHEGKTEKSRNVDTVYTMGKQDEAINYGEGVPVVETVWCNDHGAILKGGHLKLT